MGQKSPTAIESTILINRFIFFCYQMLSFRLVRNWLPV